MGTMESSVERDCEMGAAPIESDATETHCPYCALQCGMTLRMSGGAIAVEPRDFPTNKSGLCQKGWTAAELLRSPERLLSPLMRARRGDNLRRVSWHDALDRIVAEFIRAQERYGRDAVGVFGGGGLTNEKAYLLGKFARVALQTKNIDYNGRFCMSSAAAASIKAFGIDRGLPFPIEDIAHCEAILLVGANPAETMPPIMQYFEQQKRNGGTLIVADPRSTLTARTADLHLQLTPGTDAALANGLLHILAAQRLLDKRFIEQRTNGYDAVRPIVASYWPERVERITGVPASHLRAAAERLGRAQTAMILTARGAEQQSRSVDNVLAFINVALSLGIVGKLRSGFGSLTGQGNGQGGREHGQKSDQLPGYRRIDNPKHRAYIAKVWGVDEPTIPGPGVSAYELIDTISAPDGVRALMVMGSNPVVSAPDARNIANKMAALDFLVVADPFLSETAAIADVVLPTTQWAEEDGTMTNLEGRVIRRRRAAAPPPGVRSDLEILNALASRLGSTAAFPPEPREVFEELRIASAGGAADYSGISYERIEAETGMFWPCPDESHPGTPRLFADRFATEDARARFHRVEYQPPAEQPDDRYPLHLMTGRMMSHYQSGTQTRRVASLTQAQQSAFVEIHPATARNLGVNEGDRVRIVTRRGSAEMKARISKGVRMDELFAPFHWGGEGCANLLTNPALDPISGMPEFKICAARIERIRKVLGSATDSNAKPGGGSEEKWIRPEGN